MDEAQTQTGRMPLGRRIKRGARIAWLGLERLFDLLMDTLAEYFHIMLREGELFLGAALFLVGALGFQNGKNCDGNTADYISCTNPSTFYYYNWIGVTLVVVGVFLILLWCFKRARTPRTRMVE